MPGCSGLQQLLIFVNILLQVKEHKAEVDVIHLDIQMEFDTVPHHKLLSKLQKLGISGNLLKWFRAYLFNCSQCVSINNRNSDFLPVLSGVPQGSILGPLYLYYTSMTFQSIFSIPLVCCMLMTPNVSNSSTMPMTPLYFRRIFIMSRNGVTTLT